MITMLVLPKLVQANATMKELTATIMMNALMTFVILNLVVIIPSTIVMTIMHVLLMTVIPTVVVHTLP